MATSKKSREWENVDQIDDPDSLVNYLDGVTALDAVQVYKRKTYLHLNPREGHRILDVGCGVGDDVRALARIVGQSGQVLLRLPTGSATSRRQIGKAFSSVP